MAQTGKGWDTLMTTWEKELREICFRLQYVSANWRQILHLALGTAHMGTNNRNWCPDASLFHRKGLAKIIHIPGRIRMMRARAFMGFIPLKDAVRLFPRYARENGYTDLAERKSL